MSAREIDNAYKRIGGDNSYRAQRFDGMKSMLDDYTGQRIFIDSTKHPSATAAQVDHVIPLHEVQKRFPDLSLEQQKLIANDPSNYAMTNGNLNMHIKNGRMNHKVVAEQASETAKTVAGKIKKGDVSGAVKATSDYVKTSSKMIKSEVKASSKMTANGTKCRAANALSGAKNIANTVAASPEMALVGIIGNTAKNCAGGAVVGTTIVETVKSIGNNDNAETYVGNVVGKGAQAAFSAGGGAVAGELAGLGAIALGAGPVGWAVAAVGTGLLATGALSEATNDVAENIAYSVSDGVENLRLKSSLVDVPCTVAENVGLGLGLLWDNTIGSWFL